MKKLRLLTLLGALALAACSGDTGTETENNTSADSGSGGGQDTGSIERDTGSGDPLDAGDGTSTDTGEADTGTGGVADMGAGADLGQDLGQEVDLGMDMGQPIPDVGSYPCAFPSSDPMCPMADYGPGSFLERFQIETDRANGCCRDFDGDGRADNFIGFDLIPLANTFGGIDVNGNIERAISVGRLVYLVEVQNMTNERYDADVDLALLTGRDTDFDIQPNLTGMGSFYVSPDSYDQAGEPIWGFDQASVFDYELVATGGNLRVFFPGLVEAVDLWLTDVELRAQVVPGADLSGGGQIELVDGELSGALMRDRFFQSMNDVAQGCSCIDAEILQYNANANRWDCIHGQGGSDPSENCFEPRDAEECVLLNDTQLCNTFAFVSRSADLDTDNDGLKDAYSFGASFHGTTTTLEKEP